ncbi:hypothetical protein K435DRAFT_115020 [Dendrothele bispora CBS 962.96]|uniref:Uncharacterized protein n=1 Tax=Dendrothele bispora (strain CBS 962.96) TaxID=1314807 RepID=A0A4S8KNV7_DENBC|nr:hypothetical protein K435DRAFT_115020 [Dendrothele bispora CBS 962.96]
MSQNPVHVDITPVSTPQVQIAPYSFAIQKMSRGKNSMLLLAVSGVTQNQRRFLLISMGLWKRVRVLWLSFRFRGSFRDIWCPGLHFSSSAMRIFSFLRSIT